MIRISDDSKLNKVIKKSKLQKDNKWYAKKYVNHGFVPFTVHIELKKDGKKDLKPPKGYNDIDHDNYQDFVNNEANGMAIRTGCEIEDNFYLILIDIDNKETDKVKNGIDKWKLLIRDKEEIDTPTQKTGNNGLHYLFKIHKDIFETLPSSGTELEIDGQKYAIDFKAKNQFMLVEPSEYDGKTYKWTVSFTTIVQEMPKWLIKIITNRKVVTRDNSIRNKKNKVTKIPKDVIDNTENTIIVVPKNVFSEDECKTLAIYDDSKSEKQISLDDLEQYIYILNKTRADNYEQWLEVGFCLFNINKDSLYIWKKFSKQSKKYNEKECDVKWKTFRTNKDGLKSGSLYYWLKDDNADKFALTKSNIITQNILNKHSTKYKNSMIVDNIHRNTDYNYIELKDTYCDIRQDHHEFNDMYVDMYRHKLDIRCHNPLCRGKSICEHIIVPVDDAKCVFNQYVQNNYYYNTLEDNAIDDFKKINLFETDIINEAVYIGLNGKPNPFAEIIYEYNKDKYVCTDTDEWYIFEDHHWVLLKGYNSRLRLSFRSELKKIYLKVRDYYIEQEGKSSKTVKLVKQLITNFDGTQLTDDIMKELKHIYTAKNNNFSQKLNTNYSLICFTNGVYDLRTHIFRDGKTDDYISMCTGFDYTNKHTIHYKKLLKFLEDIQPNKIERDYLLTYISTALFGNTLELFTVLIGQGRNGKSKFVQLLEKTFGDYYDTIKSQLLTSQMKDGDSPSPALLSLVNKRIVVASEVLEGTKLNTGFIKFITGRDTVKHRMCHQNEMIKFAPNFVTLLVCNDIPECDNMDNAFSKRLRCINFPTEFVDGKPDKPNQKQKDDKINMYFDNWKQDLFLLLLDHYKKYENEKDLMNPTEEILKWTNQYKEYTDTYLSFLNECTEENDGHVKSADLYESFKDWFRKNNPNCKIPSSKVFSSGIRKYKNIEKIKINGQSTWGIKLMKIT
jgi:P4 family phage/plasmid primase-like protien